MPEERPPSGDPSAKDVFLDALELEGAPREAFLEHACAGRPELRERVEALLGAHVRSEVLKPLARLPVALRAGTKLGVYRLLEPLGEGGFGEVWRAEQEQPVRRDVALKVIKLGMDTAQVVRRFHAERQTLAVMNHPGIAQVFDAGATEQGRPFFAMELVQGTSITEFCARERAGLEERLRLFVNVCQAVQHAHQKGVIHRDLKPSNLLVTRHDGTPVPKVIDFGIAKATRTELLQQTLVTEHGQFVGSPAYMAPEQMQLGNQDLDTRVDVYSLGVVLYELVTGEPPFDLEESAKRGYPEMFRTIQEQVPPRPSTRVAQVGSPRAWSFELPPARHARVLQRDLDWIVMKALEKERSRRYESVGALAADVLRFLADEPVEASPPSVLYRLRKGARRHRLTVLTLAAVALALTVGTALAVSGFLRAREQERVANRAREEAEEERRHAEEERDRANAVVGLLRRMLEAPGVEVARGPDYTVRALLGDFSRGLGTELADQPVIEATMRAMIGNTYLVLDLPGEARPHLERARALRHEQLDPDHPDRLMVDVEYAQLLTKEGRFEEAIDLFQSTVPGLERIGDTHAHELSIARSHMAVALGEAGRYEEAEALIRLAFTQVDAEDLIGQAVLTSNLGLYAQDRGHLSEARRLFLEALEIHAEATAAGVGNAVEEAKVLNNLGIAYLAEGRLDEAEVHLRRAMAIVDELTGEGSFLANRTRHNLGRLLTVAGRLEEAEPLLEAALAFVRENTPPGHPDRGATLSAVSLLYSAQGRHDEFLELSLEALAIRRAALGPDHPELASSLYNVGHALAEAARLDEAEGHLREALRLVLLHEAGAPYRSRVFAKLSMVREGQGDLAEALSLMARAGAASLATGDTSTAEIARGRAANLAERIEDHLPAAEGLLAGDLFAEAEPRVRAAFDGARDEGERLRAQVLAARLRLHAGEHEEAEGMLLEVWDARPEGTSDAHGALRRDAATVLCELYDRWERAEELAAWRARLAELGAETGADAR